MKLKTTTIKVKALQGMVRHYNTLLPNTLPRFIGFDLIDGEFMPNNKVEELHIHRGNKSYYDQMIKEGALTIVGDK